FCFLNSILPSPLLHYSFHSLDNNTALTSFPTRRSSDLRKRSVNIFSKEKTLVIKSLTFFNIYYIIFRLHLYLNKLVTSKYLNQRSEEHTSELQSRFDLVCRLLLEKKNKYLMRLSLLANS